MSESFAQACKDALVYVAQNLQSDMTRLKTAALQCLCQVAKHGGELAEEVASMENVVQSALICSADIQQPVMRRSAVTLLHELLKSKLNGMQVISSFGAANIIKKFPS